MLVETLSRDLLDLPVAGASLHAAAGGRVTLADQLDPARPTLLVFLRHLGCLFSRRMVKEIRIAADHAEAGHADRRYPRVVFIHSATREQAAGFFGRYWPGVTAISDPELRLYDAVEAPRATIGQILSPRTAAAALATVWKGYLPGAPAGRPWLLPTVLLVSPQGKVLHRHAFRHAGELPDFGQFNLARLGGTGRAPRYTPAPAPEPGSGYPAPGSPAAGSGSR